MFSGTRVLVADAHPQLLAAVGEALTRLDAVAVLLRKLFDLSELESKVSLLLASAGRTRTGTHDFQASGRSG